MVQESIRLAVDWDTPYVITGIGGDPGELEDPEKMKKLILFLLIIFLGTFRISYLDLLE